MAKKAPRGAKSQAVRDYLKANKTAKAADVVAALAKDGLKVNLATVYNLKARNKMGKRRRKAEAGGEVIGLSISHLIAAKKLVDETGGMAEAKEALAALAKLV